LEITFISL